MCHVKNWEWLHKHACFSRSLIIARKCYCRDLSSENTKKENKAPHVFHLPSCFLITAAVVFAFFFCWAPFHAQRLGYVYFKESKIFRTLNEYLYYASGFFYYLSATVNPILYNLMSLKYRHAFRQTLCGKQRWWRSRNDSQGGTHWWSASAANARTRRGPIKSYIFTNPTKTGRPCDQTMSSTGGYNWSSSFNPSSSTNHGDSRGGGGGNFSGKSSSRRNYKANKYFSGKVKYHRKRSFLLKAEFHEALQCIDQNGCSDIAEEHSLTNNSASAHGQVQQGQASGGSFENDRNYLINDVPSGSKSVASQTVPLEKDRQPTCHHHLIDDQSYPECFLNFETQPGLVVCRRRDDDEDSGTGSVNMEFSDLWNAHHHVVKAPMLSKPLNRRFNSRSLPGVDEIMTQNE